MLTPSESTRAYCWCFLVYPENCNIADAVNSSCHLYKYWAFSPLHDKDINEDGTPKKSHFHFIVWFSSLKSLRQVKEISNHFSGVLPFPVQDVSGLVRYFAHLDNPDKASYDVDLIQSNHPDIQVFLDGSTSDLLRYVVDYIRDNNITYFCWLVDASFDDDKLSRAIKNKSLRSIITDYIKSYDTMLRRS